MIDNTANKVAEIGTTSVDVSVDEKTGKNVWTIYDKTAAKNYIKLGHYSYTF